MLPLNTEGTTASKINLVEHLAHKTRALIILQETHYTCVDKLLIPKFALARSIPSSEHGIATFIHESLSWTLAGQSPKHSNIEWLHVDIDGLKIVSVYKPPSLRLLTTSFLWYSLPHVCMLMISIASMCSGDTEPIHQMECG